MIYGKTWEQWFDEFWASSDRLSLGLSNPSRLYESLKSDIASCKTTDDIEYMVATRRNGKMNAKKVIDAMSRYIEKKTGKEVKIDLKNIYESDLERRLAIAKFLHKRHTRIQIEDAFHINDRTVAADLKALREGVEFMGSTIKIKSDRSNGEEQFICTAHPIYLPLNLTEVYTLIKYLPDLAEKHGDPINRDIIRDVKSRIYIQLSSYAQGKFNPNDFHREFINDYVSDERLARSRQGIAMYLMKSGQSCKFVYEDNVYEGKVRPGDDGKGIVITEDGMQFKLEEVQFLPEFLEYK